MRKVIYCVIALFTVLLTSCNEGKYVDSSTKVEYHLPDGVNVTNQSVQSSSESMYRFSFEGEGVTGRVFHKNNTNKNANFDAKRILEINDTLLYDDMIGWQLDSVDTQNQAKVYHNDSNQYRKNYSVVRNHGADFIEVIQDNADFSKFDETVNKTEDTLSWWGIIILFVAGVALLIIEKKSKYRIVLFGKIPLKWILIGLAILGTVFNLF